MDLIKLQANFADALVNDENRAELETHWVKSSPHTAARIAIYRNGLEAIWSQTLANAYPVMQKLVGADFFDLLSRDYGQQFPSLSGDLHDFGGDFPQFLKQSKTLTDYPYFSAVAELEWQIHRAYYAADAHCLGLAEFLSTVGDAAQESQLVFHSAATLHMSPWASAAVWRAHQSEEVAMLEVPLDTASFAAISRREWQVELQFISEASYCALITLQEGKDLAQALEKAMSIDASFDVAGELQTWFSFGIFSGFRCKKNPPASTNT